MTTVPPNTDFKEVVTSSTGVFTVEVNGVPVQATITKVPNQTDKYCVEVDDHDMQCEGPGDPGKITITTGGTEVYSAEIGPC